MQICCEPLANCLTCECAPMEWTLTVFDPHFREVARQTFEDLGLAVRRGKRIEDLGGYYLLRLKGGPSCGL